MKKWSLLSLGSGDGFPGVECSKGLLLLTTCAPSILESSTIRLPLANLEWAPIVKIASVVGVLL